MNNSSNIDNGLLVSSLCTGLGIIGSAYMLKKLLINQYYLSSIEDGQFASPTTVVSDTFQIGNGDSKGLIGRPRVLESGGREATYLFHGNLSSS